MPVVFLLLSSSLLAADLPVKIGYTAALSLVVSLEPVDRRPPLAVALSMGRQWFWHESPYRTDVADHLSTLATGELVVRVQPHGARDDEGRLGAGPLFSTEVTFAGGAMYPLTVADLGFQPAAGLQLGAGLGLDSSGWLGPLVLANAEGPYFTSRLDVSRAHQDWVNRRFSFGPRLELNCCTFLL